METVRADTPLDRARKLSKVILKQSSEGKELALNLNGVKFAGDIEKQLAGHVARVDDLHKRLSTLVRERCNDKSLYAPLVTEAVHHA